MIKKIKIFSRRQFLLSASTLFGGAVLSSFNLQAGERSEASKANATQARLGVNLDGIHDWGTEQPFVDFFRASRDWVSQSSLKGAKWGTGAKVNLDEFGWVKALPKDTYATRMICSLEKGQYPSGEYVVLYDGEGEFKPNHVGKVVSSELGRMVVKVDASKGAFWLDLLKTNPQNYVRNIRVIAPGFESSYLDNPWNPAFLARWTGIACLRMMDFMSINNAKQVSWHDRPKLTDASFSNKGVPVEMMVDLANRLNTDVWFCMPHKADDAYVKSFATYVKQHIKPTLKVWVEYSNEVWNTQFDQAKYAISRGKSLGLSDQDNAAGYRYTAHRSLEIFSIWDSVYGDQAGKVVNVVSAFAGYTGVAQGLLGYKNIANVADVLAIAPYVGFSVSPEAEDGVTDKMVENWSLDALFKHVNQVVLPKAHIAVSKHKAIADQTKLKLVAYESGQHLVARGAAVNNVNITKLLTKANADKRMGQLYKNNLHFWAESGGDLNCTFNSMGRWSKWGSWGLLQNNNEDPKKSPKFTAVIDWAIKQGQKMHY